MKRINYMCETHNLMTQYEQDFKTELVRQFGKKDAEMFFLAPDKYAHHYDKRTAIAFKIMRNHS